MDAYYLHQLHQDYSLKDRSINTLFVSGLPDDVKPREIHNLFRRRPGFDSCQLKYTGRGDQVVAFVTFFNHQSAVAALNTLDGVKFDPQAGSVLHIELARSNSRRKRKPGGGPYVVIDKRRRIQDDTQETSSEDGDDEHESPQDDQTSPESGRVAADPDSSKENTCHEHKEKKAEGDSRQCSTLFIANLGPNCSEEELRQAFSQYPGFNVLKLRARGGMPVAFVDFEDAKCICFMMIILLSGGRASNKCHECTPRKQFVIIRQRRNAYRICSIENEEDLGEPRILQKRRSYSNLIMLSYINDGAHSHLQCELQGF